MLERTREHREEALATFRANGGDCIYCQDRGLCEKCDRGREAIEADRIAQHERWLDRAGLPPRCRLFTFDSFPDRHNETLQEVRAFVANWDRKRGLLLLGKYGVGKTGLMAAAVNAMSAAMLASGRTVRFTSTPVLFDRLRAGYENGEFMTIMRTCQQTDLLILDDLGAEKPTEWVRERLFAIVNDRYEHNRPVWATSNLTAAELERTIGERVLWRLLETSELMAANGGNLRER